MTAEIQIQAGGFEAAYLQARKLEGRLYADTEVKLLPFVPVHHPYYNEWQIRGQSVKRLCRYLRRKKTPLAILEVGCGNGWFTHQLASIPATTVTGIDTNRAELQQAKRVFSHVANLDFVCGSISEPLPDAPQFDIIVFAASIQYFSPLRNALGNALSVLTTKGEVHMIDSPFYHAGDIAAAKRRSDLYYEQAGCPGMKDFYFHHSLDELKPFRYSLLFNPRSFVSKLSRNKNPFYWIRIQH